MKSKNILYIIIFIYIIFKLIKKKYKENFNSYSFSCITNNNYSYSRDIINIKNNLETDRFISTKSFECEKLLNLYNTITCDLLKDDLNNLDIINYLEVDSTNNKINYIDNIFYVLKTTTNQLLYIISDLSEENTLIKYISPNTNLIQNLKNEFIMKFI